MDALKPNLFPVLFFVFCLFLFSCHRPAQPIAGTNPTPSPSALANSPTSLKLTSAAFIDGQTIPRKFTCDGENLSPPIEWSGVPPGTKSLALLMEDPDAPGKTWIHWIVYDIPPDLNELSEHVASNIELAATASQGTNDFKVIGYGGPCPPSGSHRYFFKLFALDTTNLFKLPGASKDEMLKHMQGHILAEAQLMGRYR